MILKLHLGLIVALFTVTLQAQNADRAFVENVVNKYKNAVSISYDANYKIKPFDNDAADTTMLSGRCKLIRNTNDTIFGGGRIWMDFYPGSDIPKYSLYYDLDHIYVIASLKNEIEKFEPLKGEVSPIIGRMQSELKNTFYFKPERLLQYIDDKANKSTIEKVIVGNKNMVKVSINFPDEEEITNGNTTVYINQKTFEIEKITYFAQLLDQHQYNEWNLSNITFNNVTEESLDKELRGYTSKHPVKDYELPQEEDTAGLVPGTPAPQFGAQFYSNGVKTQLSDYSGKIVVLDFWYVSCHPCAIASPYLTALQQKYKNDIVVIGINPYETNTQDLKKVEGFVKRHKVGYIVAAIEGSVAGEYKVTAYPTLYVVDREGVVQYSEIGFTGDLNHVEMLIDAMLKNK